MDDVWCVKDMKLVIATPEIEEGKIKKDDEFLVLACDGLYDVMSNDAIATLVREQLKKTKNNMDRTAKYVANYAVNEKNTRDNVSVIIVKLN